MEQDQSRLGDKNLDRKEERGKRGTRTTPESGRLVGVGGGVGDLASGLDRGKRVLEMLNPLIPPRPGEDRSSKSANPSARGGKGLAGPCL